MAKQKVIVSVWMQDGTKKNVWADADNLPIVPVELAAEVIGLRGVVLYTKAAGEEDFTAVQP